MSDECKTARTVVLVPMVILLTVLIFMSSCASNTYLPCAAYVSNEYYETEGIHENLTEEQYNELTK